MATDVDELAAADAAILDALYREASADELAGDLDAGLDDPQQATLADWRAVRGVVRHARETGFDVEPPAAGSRGSFELLMTAARAHATPTRSGLWARLRAWLTPMLAHPAMAGAAALVVVGGAAGVLYLKGQQRVVRPPAAEKRPEPPPAPLPSPITEGELGDVLEARQPDDRPGPALRPEATVGTGTAADLGAGSGSATTPTAVPEGGVRPGTGAPRGGERHGSKSSPKPGSVALDPAPDDRLSEETASSEDEPAAPSTAPTAGADLPRVGGGTSTVGRDSETVRLPTSAPQAPPPPPPPAPPPITAKPPARPAQIAVDDDRPAARTPSQRTQAEQLTTQARTAAKAGDCAKVVELSRLVFALDAGYHRDVFVRDPDITRCR